MEGTMSEYKAIDFPSGMLASATAAKNINRALAENPGWEPFLMCDGPHLLGPILILRHATERSSAREGDASKSEAIGY
jgi:hypothetical protein